MPIDSFTGSGSGSWTRLKTYSSVNPQNGDQEDIRVFVCVIGGGAGGDRLIYGFGISSSSCKGGGDGNLDDGLVNSNQYIASIPYQVGAGGAGDAGSGLLSEGEDGEDSFFGVGGNSVDANGGQQGNGGTASVSSSSGGGGSTVYSVSGSARGQGFQGQAGDDVTITYTYNTSSPNQGLVTNTAVAHAGGGGTGAAIKSGGNGFPNNRFEAFEDGQDASAGSKSVDGGNGRRFGGGGGGALNRITESADPGNGRRGAIWVTYVDFTNIPNQVQDNVPFDVRVRSYWDGNSDETFTGGNTNNTQVLGYTYTDSSGARSRVYIETLPPPEITAFAPTQTRDFGSGDVFGYNSLTGIPQKQLTLAFAASPWLSNTIVNWNIRRTDTNQVVASGSTGISGQVASDSAVITLPSSNAITDSPRQRSYQLTMTDGFNSPSETITIRWRSDDNPDTIVISEARRDDGSGGFVPLDQLDSNKGPGGSGIRYYVEVTWTGTDMPLKIRSGTLDGGVNDNYDYADGFTPQAGTTVSPDAVSWTTEYTTADRFVNTMYVRFRSDPFNSDNTPSGIDPIGETGLTVGQKTPPRTIRFSIGQEEFSFDIQTRAPVIEEGVDFFMDDPAAPATSPLTLYPNPDIDTVLPNPTSTVYQTTQTELLDNLDVPVEIKVSDPLAEVSIENGPFQSVREI